MIVGCDVTASDFCLAKNPWGGGKRPVLLAQTCPAEAAAKWIAAASASGLGELRISADGRVGLAIGAFDPNTRR
jgi:hypothetical protein